MKKLLLILVVLYNVVFLTTAKAQIKVNININTQPTWGPVGYDYVDYYYLPDIETYYYVPKKQFVYLSNGNWIFGYSLPVRYRSYNLYNGYKVVVNEPKPYLQYKQHKIKYAHFKGNKGQGYIKNSKEPKYFGVKGHPNYNGNSRNAWDDDKEKGNRGHKKGGKGKKG